jgi:hypothetical protein
MRKNYSQNLNLRAACIATCFAFSLAILSLPEPAHALPSGGITCRITTYYKTEALADEIGLRSTCPGVKKWGRTSKYFEVELIDNRNEGPGGGGPGPGNLPCEFLASGCSNLPELRH